MPLYILDTTSGSATGQLIQAEAADIDVEKHLENWLESSPTVLLEEGPVLWISRQPLVPTADTVLFPDLVGLSPSGDLILVEVKRGRTPRDVIAQGLEYAAWASKLTYQELERLASAYRDRRGEASTTLEDAFREMFFAEDETALLPQLNQCQILFIVAEEIHPRVVEVARYLRERGTLDVRCVSFDVFRADSGEIVVSVDTVVGDAPIRDLVMAGSGGPWSGDKPASEVICETVQRILSQPGKETFTPSEVYREILKTYPDFNRGTNNAQIIADCVNHPSRKHYPGKKPDYYFRVDRGVYRLYDPQQNGVWDQEGNRVEPVEVGGD
jgi:hypothetical protein